MQDCGSAIAHAQEIPQYCTKPSVYATRAQSACLAFIRRRPQLIDSQIITVDPRWLER